MNTIFATFEVDIPPEIMGQVLKVEPNFFRYQPKEIISALFATARHFHPDCRTVILTDRHTQFDSIAPYIEINRFDLDIAKLTMSRTYAQLQFLKSAGKEAHIVFLDSDILIQDSLKSIFENSFDVGVTYRPHSMPINGGVILINGKSYASACHFMEQLYLKIKGESAKFQIWYGSQNALKSLVHLPQELIEEKKTIECSGMRVLLLPGSKYNFTAPGPMDHFFPDKSILHFKGTRKIFLLPYYHAYLEKPERAQGKAENTD